jgi:hypothetical protein
VDEQVPLMIEAMRPRLEEQEEPKKRRIRSEE